LAEGLCGDLFVVTKPFFLGISLMSYAVQAIAASHAFNGVHRSSDVVSPFFLAQPNR
jgi:hypothetical protein